MGKIKIIKRVFIFREKAIQSGWIYAMTCCVNFWDVLKAAANCVRMTSQDLCGADYIWQMRMRISWGFF